MDLDNKFAAVNAAAATTTTTGWSTFGPTLGQAGVQQQEPPQQSPKEPTLGQVLAAVNELKLKQVTKEDLNNMERRLLKSTEQLVEQRVKPLKDALEILQSKQAGLKAEVQELEAKLASEKTTAIGNSEFLSASLDPASKRAAFIGWPDTVNARTRLQQMEALLDNSFPEFKPVTFVNHYKGPYNNRQLGTVSFVEFGDQDTAKDFVQAVETSGVQIQAGGKSLLVKKACTQKASSRNWALRKGEELVKAAPGGAEAKLDWKERIVKVNEEVVFKQDKDELGMFKGNFAHLKLP